MQTVKITLLGKFWDSQIYMGRLYLFGLEGDLRVMNWDSLAEEIRIPSYLHYPFIASFIKGNELYSPENRELLQDAEIKNVLLKKFAGLAEHPITIDEGNLKRLTIWHHLSPFPFPHTDSLIYARHFYTVGRSGVFSARCGSSLKKPVNVDATKLWDCPVLNASASYSNMALAAGNEGLFELGVIDYANGEPRAVSEKDCTKCDWTYYSIYCSSDIGTSYMAAYSDLRGRGLALDELYQWRQFERTIDVTEIFGVQGYSWGAKDKIYLVQENNINVVKYNPWKKRDSHSPFERLGTIHLESWKGGVISASVAGFGLVIECENAMVIIPSVGDIITIPGEPVNWRIFPRSVYYENQLHIVYEDRMEILSFSHDYFVDQKTKLAGYINPSEQFRQSRRLWR